MNQLPISHPQHMNMTFSILDAYRAGMVPVIAGAELRRLYDAGVDTVMIDSRRVRRTLAEHGLPIIDGPPAGRGVMVMTCRKAADALLARHQAAQDTAQETAPVPATEPAAGPVVSDPRRGRGAIDRGQARSHADDRGQARSHDGDQAAIPISAAGASSGPDPVVHWLSALTVAAQQQAQALTVMQRQGQDLLLLQREIFHQQRAVFEANRAQQNRLIQALESPLTHAPTSVPTPDTTPDTTPATSGDPA